MKKSLLLIIVFFLILNLLPYRTVLFDKKELTKKYEYNTILKGNSGIKQSEEDLLFLSFQYDESKKNKLNTESKIKIIDRYNKKIFMFTGNLKRYKNSYKDIIYYGSLIESKLNNKKPLRMNIIHDVTTKETIVIANDFLCRIYGELSANMNAVYEELKLQNKFEFFVF